MLASRSNRFSEDELSAIHRAINRAAQLSGDGSARVAQLLEELEDHPAASALCDAAVFDQLVAAAADHLRLELMVRRIIRN